VKSILKKDIYLQRKIVCLFCFVQMKSIKLGCFILHSYSLWKALEEDVSDCILILFGKLLRRMFQIAFLLSLESSWGGGVQWAWFHGVWTWSVEVLEYWMIFSLKIKLNHSWKFPKNWNVPLVLLERSLCVGFNGFIW